MTDWFVVYTSSSGERLAKEDLEGFGYRVFLPMETVRVRPPRHRKKDRKWGTKSVPLFPRYLFVGFETGWHDFPGLRRSKRVMDVLRDGYGCPLRISSNAVTAIMGDMSVGRYDEAATRARKAALKAAEEAERTRVLADRLSEEIVAGQQIRFKSGLFKDFIATVTKVRRKDIQVAVQGEGGATLFLDVPLLSLEETGVLSQSGDGKNSARLAAASADPRERGS